MNAIRVSIVEDNEALRNNLQLIFGYYTELKVVAVYGSAEDFMEDTAALDTDVVLMDINLPGLSGIKAVELMKPRNSDVQYVMCTIYEDDESIFQSLCAGASGYILKNTAPEKFLQAIKDVVAGGSPMSPNIARRVVVSFYAKTVSATSHAALSQRENEILDLLAKGYRYKEIATQLFISIDTVRTHIRNIYEKLQVNSRTEALNKVRG